MASTQRHRTGWLLNLIFISLAGVHASGAWCQVPAPGSNPCAAGDDRPPSLEYTANLVRAELFPAAECSARRLTASVPQSADAHYLLGYILNRRDQPDASLKEYTTAAKFRRPLSNDLAIVALDYALLKDYRDAARWMTEALSGEPRNATYWYYLGRIQYNQNAFEKARLAFDRSLSLRPNDMRDLYNLGLTFEGLGQTDKAIEYYRRAITAEPLASMQDAQPYYDLGVLLARQNRPEEALPLLEKATQIEPRNPGIHEQLARAEEKTGQLDRSRKDLELAVALEPQISSLHFELGHIYQKLHMTDKARQQFSLCSTLAGTISSVGNDSLDFAKP